MPFSWWQGSGLVSVDFCVLEKLKNSDSLSPSAVSYWLSPDTTVGICLLNEKDEALWNETTEGFFLVLTAEDQTLMIPRAFSSVLEQYECKYQGEKTATLESLFSEQLELFMFPVMSSVGERMVLVMPKLQVWSPSGPLTEELELMIHVVPSI